MKKSILTVLLLVVLAVIYFLAYKNFSGGTGKINSFAGCVAAGYGVLESYPEQCQAAGGRNFVQNIGNAQEKQDLIVISVPKADTLVKSPLLVEGLARGYWFFEASFPVKITDSNNIVLGSVPAQAKGDWMTQDFVPFSANLEFENSQTATGTLILEKDNPSGLPQYDDSLRIPVYFNL